MKSATELREAWNANEDRRTLWAAIVASAEWRAATELIAAEFIQSSRAVMRHDADPVLARKLMRLDGAMAVIEALQEAAEQHKPLEAPMTEYDDDYMRQLQKQKLAQQQ
jgi:hypothetical protein